MTYFPAAFFIAEMNPAASNLPAASSSALVFNVPVRSLLLSAPAAQS